MKINLESLARQWKSEGLDLTSRRYRQIAEQGAAPKPTKGMVDAIGALIRLCVYYKTLAEASGSVDLQAERTALTAIKKEREKLKLEQEKGALIPREVPIQWLTLLVTDCKQNFWTLPKRMCETLAVMNDPKEIAEVMQKEIRQILTILSTPLKDRKKMKKGNPN